MIKLVIFDYYGVLVDAVRLNGEVFVRTFKYFGVDIKESDRVVGQRLVDQMNDVAEKYGANIDYNDFVKTFESYKAQDDNANLFNKDLILLIREISKKCKVMVLSKSPDDQIKAMLESQGVAESFTRIIGLEETRFFDEEGKKHKMDLVLQEFSIMGDEAVLIDDSPSNLIDAHELGIHPIAYINSSNKDKDFPEYCLRANSAKELSDILDGLMKENN
jgi:beta-phosphoglucomutase-like phosphatase (HAD superfamily)